MPQLDVGVVGCQGMPIRTEGYGNGGERWQRRSVKYRMLHGKYLGETCCPEGSVSSPPDKAGKHETLCSLFLLSNIISMGTYAYQTVIKNNSQKGTQCLGKNIFPPLYVLALVIYA